MLHVLVAILVFFQDDKKTWLEEGKAVEDICATLDDALEVTFCDKRQVEVFVKS